MRLHIIHFVPALLITSGLILASAQKGGPDNLVARLSFSNTYGVDWRTEKRSPQICFEVSRSGQYRLLRQTDRGYTVVGGDLSDEEMSRLGKKLKDLDLSVEGRGKLVFRGSESFVVEVSGARGAIVRSVWINPDRQQPFPSAVAAIVDWLQTFKPEAARPVGQSELEEEPICPQ